MVASLFLDVTLVYYGNRSKMIRKTKCHPEPPNRPCPDFPRDLSPRAQEERPTST